MPFVHGTPDTPIFHQSLPRHATTVCSGHSPATSVKIYAEGSGGLGKTAEDLEFITLTFDPAGGSEQVRDTDRKRQSSTCQSPTKGTSCREQWCRGGRVLSQPYRTATIARPFS
ncbi:hypothetical protein PoB_004993300 [Plakobranchus ocellatus]|uniref:Uncharacterized protein n=1 Tax=Plakobranchus ocellatus TaxID=259542 RepID=A0AAV4BXA7_9GAST|nr:hypothetical protein PoB_004993300 [Plakobranchus ocellatus]